MGATQCSLPRTVSACEPPSTRWTGSTTAPARAIPRSSSPTSSSWPGSSPAPACWRSAAAPARRRSRSSRSGSTSPASSSGSRWRRTPGGATAGRAEVVVADFDVWEPTRAGFDAVVAFSSFHWLHPTERFEKAARLLRPGGHLAVVGSQHVAGDDSFFAEVQEDYDAVVPDERNRAPRRPEEVGDLRDLFAASGCFEEVVVRRYLWEIEYTADTYIEVLETYSGHRSMEPARRAELYERIRRRIEARLGGRVSKTNLALLHVSRKR